MFKSADACGSLDLKQGFALFSEHYHFLRYYVLKLGATREDCEDILQEAFFRWIKASTPSSADNVRRMLIALARNLYIERCRLIKQNPGEVSPDFRGSVPGDRGSGSTVNPAPVPSLRVARPMN